MWYNKTHSAIVDWEADWTISDEPAYLYLEDILHLLTDDRLETVLLSDIAWKGKHKSSLVKQDLRYRNADPYIPGIVAFNAPNPYNNKYRMIDGKHRMHKLVSENVKESEFYVLDFEKLRPLFVSKKEAVAKSYSNVAPLKIPSASYAPMLEKNPIDEDILEEIYKIIEPFISILKDNPTKKVVPDWEKYVSKESLDEIYDKDVPKNLDKNLIRVLTRGGEPVESIEHGWTLSKLRFIDLAEIEWLVQSAFPKKRVQLSGDFYYPPTGFMGWHTNNDQPYDRVYINYASADKKSFFRYFEGGQIVTDYDKIGMNARKFTCPGEPPYFWHCVGSECDRISFGFKLL